jgi:hypothetical protein
MALMIEERNEKEKTMEQQKPWYKSKTLIGLIVAAVGAFAPKYAPLLDLVGPALDAVGQVATVGGLAIAGYGRVKANTQVTLKKPTEGN